MIQRTLSIVKPDAVKERHIGQIVARLEKSGLRVVAMKMLHLSKDQAERFYEVHRGKPFYPALVSFMSSGPVVVQVLEGKNAVALNRQVMGATNPAQAAEGTIRKDFAKSIDENAVHGSDSEENARIEIEFFFGEAEIYSPAKV